LEGVKAARLGVVLVEGLANVGEEADAALVFREGVVLPAAVGDFTK
jgi:hypothetical protein